MCPGLAAAGAAKTMFGLQVASAGFGLISGYINANRQVKHAERVATATSRQVREDLVRQYSLLARREVEEQQATSRRILDLTREASEARGMSTASAAAAGVEGTMTDTILRDLAFQEQVRVEAAFGDRETSQVNLQSQREAIEASGRNRITSSIGPPVKTPNIFNTLFQIGGAYLNYRMNAPIQGGGLPNPSNT